MSEIVNEVCQKMWVYDKAGKGKLCDTRAEAEALLNGGEYSDHPNGDFAKVESSVVESGNDEDPIFFDADNATKAELLIYCSETGIEVPEKATKKQLMKLIEEECNKEE